MLELKNITKKYGKTTVLDDLTCEFDKGVNIIVGTNGCGKSTLLNIIGNLDTNFGGDVLFEKNFVSSIEYKMKTFYLPSDFYLPEFMTGKEYIDFIISLYPNSCENHLDDLIKLFKMDNSIDKMISNYSFGMKKKIQFIASVCSNAKLYLFDELFSGLDFETTIIIEEIISHMSKNKTILLVSHDINTLKCFPQNIMIMSGGRLNKFSDDVDQIVKRISEMVIDEELLKSIGQDYECN